MRQLHPQNPPMRIPLFSWLFLMPMICLLSIIGFCISAVSGQCLGDQQSLLLQLKNSLVFDNAFSTKLVRWNQSVDCCSWKGVTCNEGLVIGLDLNNEGIGGGLDNSSSLFGLRYLQRLNLAHNYYSDQIPSQFDKLSNLSYLNLSNAGFKGQIPIAISHLTRLVTLDLSDNYVDGSYGVYASLKLESPNLNMLVQNLSELIELYVGSVNISSQGYEWGPALSSSLPKLRVLSLSNCYLSGPRDSLSLMVQNLSELMELYVDGVDISTQGYEWGPALSSSLPKLRVLSLSNCYISGPLDSSLTNLQSLSIIRLDGNNFSSPVPEFFANFKNLMSLDFDSSGLNGKFPEKIFQISTLQTLDLSRNELLQGSFPEFPLNGSLRILVLEETNFSGILPHSIGNLKMLSEIHLSGCNFNGSIPNSMASLTKLVYLDMSNNNFDGSIPSFSMSKNLTTIDLSNNVLTGQITFTRWEELLNLEVLDLSNNSLEGNIPISLFSLPSLSSLVLSNNRFSGQLTEFSIVSSDLLRCIDLNNNNLEGPIPMSVFKLRGLDTLLLSWNNFSGSLQLNVIPTMRKLIFLDLSHNSLASSKLKTFPHFLINESILSNLDLSDNQLDGEIPNWIWELPYLNFLNLSYNYLETLDFHLLNMSFVSSIDLRSNQLQGQLSVFPKGAQFIDFSMNNFNSTIPVGIGFPSFLLLSSNKLYGSIPGSICNATNLIALDLSNNFLSGTVPQCLIEMSKTIGVLNLRRNNLTGTIPNTFPSNCSLQIVNLNGNQLEGKLPKSLANCTSLEFLDLGNNQIKDAFPCYLKNISMLRVLIFRSNKFYGPIDCPGPNAAWPMLQIVDIASNNFTGLLPIKYLSNWKAIMDDKSDAQSQLNYLHFEGDTSAMYIRRGIYISYQYVVTITMKDLELELPKILTIFTSLDFSCNNFDGHIPEEVGELKLLYILNLSHNAFTGQIPRSLGKLTYLESLDLSSNDLSGEIPDQLADGLIFLSVLNLSFNQLVGKIPHVKQFATFLENSYEGNIGLCGFPLKKKCTPEEPRSSPPTSKESHSNFGNAIDWNFLSVELGFVFGFGIFIGPLMFWKKWRICYYKHADDIFFKMFPRLYIRIENRQRRAHRNQGQRAHRNQGQRH